MKRQHTHLKKNNEICVPEFNCVKIWPILMLVCCLLPPSTCPPPARGGGVGAGSREGGTLEG